MIGNMGRELGSNGDKNGNNGNETGDDAKESCRETQREEREAGGNGNMEGREERGGVSVKGGKEGTERNSGEKGKVHLSPSDFQQVELGMPPLLLGASFFFKTN